MKFYHAAALSVAVLGGSAWAGPELAGPAPEDYSEETVVRKQTARRSTKVYTEIAPQAVYARPQPAPIVHTFGTRRYAGRQYLIVPGQWYPPVWEDACAVKRTCAIPGVAPWPGVRIDVNSDEIPLAPLGPPPIPVLCYPGAPLR